jgi:TatD DNase family protein
LGFKIGLGGNLTYERAQALRRLAQALPLTDIVLETDAPDMPMAKQDGARQDGARLDRAEKDEPNRPDNLPRVLAVLAQLRPESLAEIAMQTVTNTIDVLRLKSLL